MDPSAWLKDLNAPIRVLETALGDVAREVREAQASSDTRNRALSANEIVLTHRGRDSRRAARRE